MSQFECDGNNKQNSRLPWWKYSVQESHDINLKSYGLLCGKHHKGLALHRATIAQVALIRLIHFSGDIVVAIPGASKAHQAQGSAGTMKFVLSGEDLDRLDRASRDLKK